MNRKHLAPDDRVSSAVAQVLGLAKPLLTLLVVVLVAGMMIGCGTPGAPLAPSLNLPTPVLNLSANRVGNSVRLAWSMPTRTTDKVILRHPVAAQVCRAVETGPCADIASLTLKPGGAGEYVDALPANLTQGPGRLLRYEVALRNHAGKSAGPSNAAYSAAGTSPAAMIGLTAAAADQAPKSPLAPVAPAAAQTLVVHSEDGVDPGHAVDTSALFNQQYRYVLERVATLALSGRSVEVQGLPSDPIVITTTDVFPPAVPQGLVAVADATAGAIDLSWSPDSESDLAAYHIYRRDIHTDLAPQRISSVSTETSFRDTGAQPGHAYAYSVSAIDQSGNESARSPEVEETLPTQ